MQTRSLLFAGLAALLISSGISSCRKTIEVGNKPSIEVTPGPEYYLTSDSTLVMDKRYTITVKADRAEDLTPNTYFEIVRTYSGGGDTTMFETFLEGADQTSYTHTHTFTTLKKAGTERFVFTVKNNYGITNQKIMVFTVR
jgi:hypothetical protein